MKLIYFSGFVSLSLVSCSTFGTQLNVMPNQCLDRKTPVAFAPEFLKIEKNNYILVPYEKQKEFSIDLGDIQKLSPNEVKAITVRKGVVGKNAYLVSACAFKLPYARNSFEFSEIADFVSFKMAVDSSTNTLLISHSSFSSATAVPEKFSFIVWSSENITNTYVFWSSSE